ncbi:MAG: CocE/NonD family hydrolase [Planctomycetaceae bacterium]
MSRRLPVLFVYMVAVFQVAAAEPAPFTVDVDVMVPMRDGVKLATDVYRPVRDGRRADDRRPVILIRTPYGKGNGESAEGKYFAAHGYVVVLQDTRGRYRSEGIWHFLTDDGQDGYDCADWIVAQPWSNGRIGMMGTSYVGGTQHALAMSGSPNLATVIPVDAVSNMGRQSMRNAGAFELRFWNWIVSHSGEGSRQVRDPGAAAVLAEMAAHRLDYLKLLPPRRGTTPLKLVPEYEDWLVEAMRHGADDEFWDQNNIVGHPERYRDIPVYLVGGWYDFVGWNTTANFSADEAIAERRVSDHGTVDPRSRGANARAGHVRVRRSDSGSAGSCRVVRSLSAGSCG